MQSLVNRAAARDSYDAIVIGSGPNGLAAAITLAQANRSVLVVEAADTIGGGMRTAELTEPGFLHDICSAIHPLGVASSFFVNTPLHEFGLEWIHPEVPVAHPMPEGPAAIVPQSLNETVQRFGIDGNAYRRLVEPFVNRSKDLFENVLGPLSIPSSPILMARFGMQGLWSANHIAKTWFSEDRIQGMFAGLAAHSILPLNQFFTGAVGLMFAVTMHADGWPLPKGGSQSIANAMGKYLISLGGEIIVGNKVDDLQSLPNAKAILFDTTPRELIRIAGDQLPAGYRRRLERFRHGPGVFKIDWALSDPIPWKDPECAKAGTVHVGGAFDDVAAAEAAAWTDQPADRPFVLAAQQSLFDDTRAPAGKHTGWGYCHVPHGCTIDMTDAIEAQIERFAPGFRDCILHKHVMAPSDFQAYNANYIGGDITAGVMDAWQLLTRPVARLDPYSTPNKQLFLCSASTPPGPGVHGMCGFHAAKSALRNVLR